MIDLGVIKFRLMRLCNPNVILSRRDIYNELKAICKEFEKDKDFKKDLPEGKK